MDEHSTRSRENAMDMRVLVGSDVVSRDGSVIGSVKRVFIDPQNLALDGIEVRTPFFKSNYYIGRNYIANLTPTNIFLKIHPIDDVVGKTVYDARGNKIGSVKEIERNNNTNSLKNLHISRGIGRDGLVLPGNSIDHIGESVFLKESVEV